jgi:DNA-binding NarL/FixJ family response regulator
MSSDRPCPVALVSPATVRLLEPLREALDGGFDVRTEPFPSDGIAVLGIGDAPRLAELRELSPRLAVVVVADHDRFVEPSLVADAFEAGADAYVGSGSLLHLVAHIRALARRQRHLSALDRVLAGAG